VGCAGSSEHGPHLLREGHMGEGGGGRWLVCRLTVEDGVGRTKVGGKVGLKLNKLNFNVQLVQQVM